MEPDREQKEVIDSIKKNRITLVEAPPGTGKTYTAVYAAIEYVKENIKVESSLKSKVLILTFSKNARAQIEKQLEKLDDRLINYKKYIEISNYHSFYQKYIWAYSNYLNLPSDLIITPPSKRKRLVADFLLEKNINTPTVAQIGWASDLLDGDFRPVNKHTRAFSEIQKIISLKDEIINYILDLNKKGEVSFSDFGYYVKQLIQKSNSLLNILRNKYQFIILDEYQDSSDIQDFIVKELIGVNNKGLFFSDTKQMIYGWRGAKDSRIQDLKGYYTSELNMIELIEIHRYKNKEDLINLISKTRSDSYDCMEFQDTLNIKYIDIKVQVDKIDLYNAIIRGKCYYNLKYKILNEINLYRGKTLGILCRTNDIVEYIRKSFKVDFRRNLKELNNSEKEHDLLYYVYEFVCSGNYTEVDKLIKFVFFITFSVCYEKEFGKVKRNKLQDVTSQYITNIKNKFVKKVKDCFTDIKNQEDLRKQLIIYLKFLLESDLSINRDLINLVIKFLRIKENDKNKVNSLLLQHQHTNSYKELKGEYVLNIHQSKGREFDIVFIIDSNSVKKDANLFYVAISRAKEKVVFFNWTAS